MFSNTIRYSLAAFCILVTVCLKTFIRGLVFFVKIEKKKMKNRVQIRPRPVLDTEYIQKITQRTLIPTFGSFVNSVFYSENKIATVVLLSSLCDAVVRASAAQFWRSICPIAEVELSVNFFGSMVMLSRSATCGGGVLLLMTDF